MCLLLGPPSVGKTLLLKRLNTCSNRGSYASVGEAPATIPTVGTNLINVVLGRRGEVTVRELGGCMAPIWHNYFDDCQTLMFMMDLSNRCQVSASCILLLEIINNSKLKSLPLLVILNKIDSPSALTRQEFEDIIRMNDIINCCDHKVTVLEISAKDGQGLQSLAKWMQDNVKL